MPKVTLHQKLLTQGKISLFLDFYPPVLLPKATKPSRREYLRLYLFEKPHSQAERQHNKHTLAQAASIRAQRQLALQAHVHQLPLPRQDEQKDFLHFFEQLALQKAATCADKYVQRWRVVLQKLTHFAQGALPIHRLTKSFCEAFRAFLTQEKACGSQQTITDCTASDYLGIFKHALRAAYEQDLLPENLAAKLKGIAYHHKQRNFLTLEELVALANTPCGHTILRKAALFSALAGLRYSDIYQLTWRHVHTCAALGPYLLFVQHKTSKSEVLPIAQPAYALLGERQSAQTRVFEGLPEKLQATHSQHLRTWIQQAGISKAITFHCFRHTFATLHLTLGTDIYTVSKLLGHTKLATTQLYTQVIDTKKKAAVDLLDTYLNTTHPSLP